MKRVFLLILILLIRGFSAFSQEEPRTIRVRKESSLVKAVFENTDRKLVVMDRFGNPRENRIESFSLHVKGSRETRKFEGFSNSLTGEMINFLNRQPKAVKIFFTGIVAVDENGHPVELPDVIDTWFPDCRNCDGQVRRKR